MCGILFCNKVRQVTTRELLKKLSLRGRNGYGVYTRTIGRDDGLITKSLENIEKSDKVNDIDLGSKIVVANSRAIPTTEYESGAGLSTDNQAPFENEHYVVVLNGIIANDKQLIEEFKLTPPSKVDTSILPELFSRIGIIDGLRMLKGSFAIICYDKYSNHLFVAKNFMPLKMFRRDDSLIISSIQEMFEINSLYILPTELIEMDPYSIYEFNLDSDNSGCLGKYPLVDTIPNKKVLVICSGGIDSTTTAWLYKHLGYSVKLIHFKYGQAAQECEEWSVRRLAEDLDTTPIIIDANHIFKPFRDQSKLLCKSRPTKGKQMWDAESTFSYVPNRNSIFAAISCAVAEKLGCSTVAYGGQQMDSVYPDNNPGFVDGVNRLLPYSLNWNTKIKFSAPLIHLIKNEVMELAQKLNVPFDKICSCYYPKLDTKHKKVIYCGKCGCCQFWFNSQKMVKDMKNISNLEEFIDKYILWNL